MPKTQEQKDEAKRIKAEKKEAEEKARLEKENGGGAGPELTPTPPTTTTKPKAPETVEVKKEDFEKLMAQLERQQKDIALLYSASDKERIARALNNGNEILIKKVNVWTWDNNPSQIVIASKMITNKSEIVNNRWVEEQTIEVFLEDGQSFIVPYLEFSRRILYKIPGEITGTNRHTEGNGKEAIVYDIELEDGRKLKINSAFIN